MAKKKWLTENGKEKKPAELNDQISRKIHSQHRRQPIAASTWLNERSSSQPSTKRQELKVKNDHKESIKINLYKLIEPFFAAVSLCGVYVLPSADDVVVEDFDAKTLMIA